MGHLPSCHVAQIKPIASALGPAIAEIARFSETAKATSGPLSPTGPTSSSVLPLFGAGLRSQGRGPSGRPGAVPGRCAETATTTRGSLSPTRPTSSSVLPLFGADLRSPLPAR
ncbi:hypothetical protein MRX96_049596 [Rhipicephalus microplus]